MPPKNSSDKSSYKSKMKLDLEKFKNGGVQATRVDLARVKIKTVATKIGVLSEGVNNICIYSIQRGIMLQMIEQSVC